jgi:hypothetical protein
MKEGHVHSLLTEYLFISKGAGNCCLPTGILLSSALHLDLSSGYCQQVTDGWGDTGCSDCLLAGCFLVTTVLLAVPSSGAATLSGCGAHSVFASLGYICQTLTLLAWVHPLLLLASLNLDSIAPLIFFQSALCFLLDPGWCKQHKYQKVDDGCRVDNNDRRLTATDAAPLLPPRLAHSSHILPQIDLGPQLARDSMYGRE